MNPRIQIRRDQARVTRIAMRRMADERMGVHDPAFNVREIVKQMVLLEDHLSHRYKICPDCIRKHLLTIEALAEEATCLDTGRIFGGGAEAIADIARAWMESFLDGQDKIGLAEKVRFLRKRLCSLVADPRGMAQRVATRYQERRLPCQHG